MQRSDSNSHTNGKQLVDQAELIEPVDQQESINQLEPINQQESIKPIELVELVEPVNQRESTNSLASELIAQALSAAGGVATLHAVRSLRVVLQRQVRVSAGNHAEQAKFHTYSVEICRAQGGKIRIVEYLSPLQRQVTILQGLAGIRRWENLDPDPLELGNLELGNLNEQMFTPTQLSATEVSAIKRRVRLYPRNFLAHAAEFHYQLIDPTIDPVIDSVVDPVINPTVDRVVNPPVVTNNQIFHNLSASDHQIDLQQFGVLKLPAEQVCYLFQLSTGRCEQLIDYLTNEIITYHDYRVIDGVLTPYLEEIFCNGQLQQRDVIESVSYNLDLAPELFALS